MADAEKLAEAHRWMGRLPRDQFDMLLLLTTEARMSERKETLRDCILIANEHRCKPNGPLHRGQDNTTRLIAEEISGLIYNAD